MPTPVSSADERFEREALTLLPDVSRYARSLTAEDTLADDLVQDTFLAAYENWAQFEPGTECRAWLFTICRNRFMRLRARDDRQAPTDLPELEALAAAALHTSASTAGLDDLFERSEILAAVNSAVAALPDSFREVVNLIDMHDYRYEEASAALGVPVGTVRSRLFRGRRLIQERLLAHARDLGLTGRRRGAEDAR